MTIGNGYEITMKKSDKGIRTNVTVDKQFINVTPTDKNYARYEKLYLSFYGKVESEKQEMMKDFNIENFLNGDNSNVKTEIAPEEKVKKAITNMMKFFTEFGFQPNFRFLNTLSRYGKKEGCGYISRYFELINSPYATAINDKIKSREFTAILEDFFSIKTDKAINNRFKLYYGSQGTGKTTQGLEETNGVCIICNNAMLPNDLMEDFTFDNGKATFHPSALCLAMQNGTPIVLDEINLLPFESLRFLQGILDDKKSFEYKGNTIQIADGFKVIGTMNLTVNGMTYGLPEPLVDRCEETKKFDLTADNLIGAII